MTDRIDPNQEIDVELTLNEMITLHLILRRCEGDPEKSMMKHALVLLRDIEATLLHEKVLTISKDTSGDNIYRYNGEDLDQYLSGKITYLDLPEDLKYLLETDD